MSDPIKTGGNAAAETQIPSPEVPKGETPPDASEKAASEKAAAEKAAAEKAAAEKAAAEKAAAEKKFKHQFTNIVSNSMSGLATFFNWTWEKVRSEPFAVFMLVAFFGGLIVLVLEKFGILEITQAQSKNLLYVLFIPMAAGGTVYFLRAAGISERKRSALEWAIVAGIILMFLAFAISMARSWLFPSPVETPPKPFPANTISLTPSADLDDTGLFKLNSDQSTASTDADYVNSMKTFRDAIEQGLNPTADNQRLIVGVASDFSPPYNTMSGKVACAGNKKIIGGAAFLFKIGDGTTANTRPYQWRQLPFRIKAIDTATDKYDNTLQVVKPEAGEQLILIAVVSSPIGTKAKFESPDIYSLTVTLENK